MPRNDYTPAQRAAWQAGRLAAERARGNHSAGINALPRAGAPLQSYEEAQKQLGATLQRVQTEMNARIKGIINEELKKHGPSRAEVEKAAKAGKTLRATTPSSCLASLEYDSKEGVAVAEFYRGGAVVYDYPMSLNEFIEWADSESLGKFGNENVFD
jgi:hypothetical protein